MQITEITGKAYNKKSRKLEDLYDPEKNVVAGVRYIQYLFKTHPAMTYEDISQLYNIGETGYFKRGIRAPEYKDKFIKEYYKAHKRNSTF